MITNVILYHFLAVDRGGSKFPEDPCEAPTLRRWIRGRSSKDLLGHDILVTNIFISRITTPLHQRINIGSLTKFPADFPVLFRGRKSAGNFFKDPRTDNSQDLTRYPDGSIPN